MMPIGSLMVLQIVLMRRVRIVVGTVGMIMNLDAETEAEFVAFGDVHLFVPICRDVHGKGIGDEDSIVATVRPDFGIAPTVGCWMSSSV